MDTEEAKTTIVVKKPAPKQFERMLEEYDFQRPQRGEVIEGTVTHVDDNSLLVDIGGKRDALVPAGDLKRLDEEFVQNLSRGDQVSVFVLGRPRQGRDVLVSIERALEQEDWGEAEKSQAQGETLDLEIIGYNRGGLLVRFNSLEGFVPNSHIPDLGSGRNVDEARAFKQQQVGGRLSAKIIEVDPRQRRLVLSARVSREKQRAQRLQELEVGQVLDGQVTGLADFGAFVDLGGIRGLIHISELDWRRLNHPSDVLAVGDEVQVKIKRIDEERQRIGLSRKALLPNPWHSLRYAVGELLEGTVTQTHDFGTFVRLPDGLEGLVPRVELERSMGADPDAADLHTGQVVQVRVTGVDADRERIRLSLHHVGESTEA